MDLPVLAILLLIVGLAFVVAEVFFVSMGVLSLMAGASILVADILAFEHSRLTGWIFVAGEVVLVPLLVVLALRLLPHLPFGRRMLLQGPATEPTGGFPSLEHLVGRTGRALTPLRPSGKAEFDGEQVSVVAAGRLIAEGAGVVAVAVQGSEVKVRPFDPDPSDDDED